jgi:hypothetical protein
MPQPSTQPFTINLLRTALLTAMITVASLLAFAGDSAHVHDDADASKLPAKLVHDVRVATQQFINVNNAGPAGYAPAFGCVSGPDHGAMGIHYLNGSLLNGQIDAAHPQALIYEPVGNKRRIVGVEFIVDATTWLNTHDGVPPQLEGQAFQFVDAPNRFGIPSFFELHVWAWRDNPQGAFVDWNNQVSCEGQ